MTIMKNQLINKALTDNFRNRENKNENQTQRFHRYILSLQIIVSSFIRNDDTYLRLMLRIKVGILMSKYHPISLRQKKEKTI